MKKPLLSVITPVYNCEKYIEYSLKSLFNQTFQDFELFLINDGSTDNTWSLVQSLCEPHSEQIILISHDDNLRIPIRRNEAISLAQGKYIAIFDGDDISFDYRFQGQIEFMEENPDIFCVGGLAERMNGDDIGGIMDYPPENHNEILAMITKKNMNPVIDPTTVFRRKVFNKLGGYTLEKEIYTVPDFDLWTRAILKGYKFHNIQYPMIKYRVNPQGMTTLHKKEMIKAHMIVWRRFMSCKLPSNYYE